MEQLILHLIGDYVTQSDWMANGKTSKYGPALAHATVYSLPFVLLTHSWLALFVIWSTHFVIDRFRLAKYVVWAKNLIQPSVAMRGFDPYSESARKERARFSWGNCKATGYPSETPVWLAVSLMIIADNTMHLAINFLSIKYF